MSSSEANVILAELKGVNVRLDNLEKKFDEAANGGGFRRCSNHSVRLKHVEDDVKLSHARISGIKKYVIGLLIGIASAAVKCAWSLLESSTRN